MIQVECSCGAQLQVLEVYAGGHVVCRACGSSVHVSVDAVVPEEKFRFHCPHCDTRVLGRKASAGKKSHCPACGQTYIVPEPPPEPDLSSPPDNRRISIDADELTKFRPLPFPVGKLEKPTAAPPRARYIHPHEEFHETRDAIDRPLPAEDAPPPAWTPSLSWAAPPIASSSAQHVPPALQSPETPPVLRGEDRESDAAAPPEPPLVGESFAPADDSESIPTAASISQIPFVGTPSSVGELQVMGGGCTGQRIRMDFHRFVIGAERDCDLRPASPLLSRHHCVFKKDEYAVRVRDLGSNSGTFVNGRRIFSEVVLGPGDEVTVGDVSVYVFLPHSPQVTHTTADSNPSINDFVIL